MRRRPDSCTPCSAFMRHRVRRSWRAWEAVGASGQVLRWIREGIRVPFRQGCRPQPFNHGVSLQDATQQQLQFILPELERLLHTGALERGSSGLYISRCFLVPKPGTNQWRLVVDLRELNAYCDRMGLKLETLQRLRHLTQRGDWMISFDQGWAYLG